MLQSRIKNRQPAGKLVPDFPARQKGAVLVLYAIGMLAIMLIAGLALDGAHAMLNKSRLQNTVDAAALAAAKVLDDTANEPQARTAAVDMFTSNSDDAGNRELWEAWGGGGGDIDVTVQFSSTVAPFQPGTTPANYVRVIATNFTMPAWLIQLMGMQEKIVSASAVAGPSPTVGQSCDLVPLIVCGDPAQPPNPADPTSTIWGYDRGQVHVIKGGSQSGSQSGPIGPGNFFTARPGDSSGGADLRENLAGGAEGCTDVGKNVETEPGNSVGPVVQGINTRLNRFSGPIDPGDYPPDVIVEQQASDLEYDDDTGNITLDNGATVVNSTADLDFSYDDYTTRAGALAYDLQPSPAGPAVFDRRNMPIYIADCTGSNTGQTSMPILAFGCFFLLQEASQKGNQAELYGEFLEQCSAEGVSGQQPSVVPGPYRIQLYKDSGSIDS
jgi:hypothetical protein